ncbi:M23 family metallopeptidase [Sphingobacterium shayense]|nr:M23 family metallopeptidase [Sphingobacterium shayense]
MNTTLKIYLALFLVFLGSGRAFSQHTIRFHPPLPVVKITSPFGSRVHPVTGIPGFHSGVDLAARDSPVYSMLTGKVLRTGAHPYLGNFITVGCSNIEVTYGHLSKILVSKGEPLYPGKCIAVSGRTGRVTGEHLHLSIKHKGKYLCPIRFMNSLHARLTALPKK